MQQRLQELIASLEKTTVAPENKQKLQALILLLKNKTANINTDDNWAAEKVIEIVCMTREIMQDKNKHFKLFCTSLKPTHIHMNDWVYSIFFGEEEIKNKMEPKR